MSHQPDQKEMNLAVLNEQAVAGASSPFKEQELTTENKPSGLVDSVRCVVQCKFWFN